MIVSDEVMLKTAQSLKDYADYWQEEIPIRIHSRDTADDGAPGWSSDFAMWLTRTETSEKRWQENPEPRVRTTRAFRKLRRQSPREYEVLYRICILGERIPSTVNWLNDRSIRGNHPERYTREDVLMILIVAVDKIDSWW